MTGRWDDGSPGGRFFCAPHRPPAGQDSKCEANPEHHGHARDDSIACEEDLCNLPHRPIRTRSAHRIVSRCRQDECPLQNPARSLTLLPVSGRFYCASREKAFANIDWRTGLANRPAARMCIRPRGLGRTWAVALCPGRLQGPAIAGPLPPSHCVAAFFAAIVSVPRHLFTSLPTSGTAPSMIRSPFVFLRHADFSAGGESVRWREIVTGEFAVESQAIDAENRCI